ncbi:MAG: hypothetical protein KAS95_04895 [Candidatus Heimdallarchaeota archaeon]|nr:hypothetical protein [Candidatus Heimdallarchaeota archaeon]
MLRAHHGDVTYPPTPPTSSHENAYGFAFGLLLDVDPRITMKLVHIYNPSMDN